MDWPTPDGAGRALCCRGRDKGGGDADGFTAGDGSDGDDDDSGGGGTLPSGAGEGPLEIMYTLRNRNGQVAEKIQLADVEDDLESRYGAGGGVPGDRWVDWFVAAALLPWGEWGTWRAADGSWVAVPYRV